MTGMSTAINIGNLLARRAHINGTVEALYDVAADRRLDVDVAAGCEQVATDRLLDSHRPTGSEFVAAQTAPAPFGIVRVQQPRE